ncbi:DNA-binding NarL/FixJ family response regulator [Dyadobacter jejuensis]|uniref:DNA-binding NarL/FixJ family response regulator n=1 Tax=Dyadobacter jejuensis TaxID=1082580 RepID=A0A316B3L5_9BACT|nr:response regulator transcription factor [Dyadobacter jejuensis]PWJ57157.1 DNA-binding NarL/FixJ family response regulator [Dyadobacter jejuensis]
MKTETTTNKVLRLGIADDHELFRKGFIAMLSGITEYEFILEAGNGQELLDKMALDTPDIVFMDLQMPIMDGIQATELAFERFPNIKIIVVSMYNEDRFVIDMLEKGVQGYLLKDTSPDEVEKAIHRVAEEGFYYNDFVSKAMHRKMATRATNKHPHFPNACNVALSPREQDVLQLICDGLSTSEIAEKLFISIRTVEGHRLRVLDKTGTKNTAAAVAFAYKNHLI